MCLGCTSTPKGPKFSKQGIYPKRSDSPLPILGYFGPSETGRQNHEMLDLRDVCRISPHTLLDVLITALARPTCPKHPIESGLKPLYEICLLWADPDTMDSGSYVLSNLLVTCRPMGLYLGLQNQGNQISDNLQEITPNFKSIEFILQRHKRLDIR